MFEETLKEKNIWVNHIIPNVPAVNPTTKKNVNSKRSLGREFIIKLN